MLIYISEFFFTHYNFINKNHIKKSCDQPHIILCNNPLVNNTLLELHLLALRRLRTLHVRTRAFALGYESI